MPTLHFSYAWMTDSHFKISHHVFHFPRHVKNEFQLQIYISEMASRPLPEGEGVIHDIMIWRADSIGSRDYESGFQLLIRGRNSHSATSPSKQLNNFIT